MFRHVSALGGKPRQRERLQPDLGRSSSRSSALLALGVAGVLVREVLAASQGTQQMQDIARAIQEGAAAYLRRQFKTLGVFVVIIFFVLLLLPVPIPARACAGAAVDLLPGRRAVLGADRVHRHVAVRPRQRPGGGRRPGGR